MIISTKMVKPYFKYDLGSTKYIKAVVVIGRLGGWKVQSTNWIAKVGNDGDVEGSNAECLGGSASGGQEVACNAHGRFVFIQK